ncbi:hypothetical protein DXT99_14805 [Pontibacter diazotrophicus]|uniref:Uncharacterized protein n=1 Tax=Pontibacter diazotrophicus TaxID=1400979 RepID=A0A3D8LAH8_9BACT|nr:hypothetical protein DXT99_14805 [Pontibacter diazotrophicus]
MMTEVQLQMGYANTNNGDATGNFYVSICLPVSVAAVGIVRVKWLQKICGRMTVASGVKSNLSPSLKE